MVQQLDSDDVARQYPPQQIPEHLNGAKISSFASWNDFALLPGEKLGFYRAVEDQVERECSDLPPLSTFCRLSVGLPCAAFFEDDSVKSWGRGKILAVDADHSKARVIFVDTGDELDDVPSSDIRPLPQHLANLSPPCAVFCKLSENQANDPALPDPNSDPVSALLVGEEDGLNVVWLEFEPAQKKISRARPPSAEPPPAPAPSRPLPAPPSSSQFPQNVARSRNDASEFVTSSKDSYGKKGLNPATRLDYTPCRVEEVWATCGRAVLNPNGRDGEGIVIYPQQSKLHHGSITVPDLSRLICKGDLFKVFGTRMVERVDEDNDNVVYGEWQAKDLWSRRPTMGIFHTHAIVTERNNKYALLQSRIFGVTIKAPASVFHLPPGQDLDDLLCLYRTVVVRGRRQPTEEPGVELYEALAVELVEPLEQDQGVFYFVRENYAVILRTKEGDKGDENVLCRYIFTPINVVDAEGIPQNDWYGRPVTFAACEDQPGQEEASGRVIRWKAVSAHILKDQQRTSTYRWKGIWYPKPDSTFENGDRRLRNEVERMDVPNEVETEWRNHSGSERRERSDQPAAQTTSATALTPTEAPRTPTAALTPTEAPRTPTAALTPTEAPRTSATEAPRTPAAAATTSALTPARQAPTPSTSALEELEALPPPLVPSRASASRPTPTQTPPTVKELLHKLRRWPRARQFMDMNNF